MHVFVRVRVDQAPDSENANLDRRGVYVDVNVDGVVDVDVVVDGFFIGRNLMVIGTEFVMNDPL